MVFSGRECKQMHHLQMIKRLELENEFTHLGCIFQNLSLFKTNVLYFIKTTTTAVYRVLQMLFGYV